MDDPRYVLERVDGTCQWIGLVLVVTETEELRISPRLLLKQLASIQDLRNPLEIQVLGLLGGWFKRI